MPQAGNIQQEAEMDDIMAIIVDWSVEDLEEHHGD